MTTPTLNSNFEKVEDAFDNTLSRDGTAPNFMEAELDMNSHRIINLAAPTASNDAVRLVDLPTSLSDLGDLANFTPAGGTAVVRTIRSKLRDTVSVKDFGAVCDGVTNDAAAVQLAITYCVTNGGVDLLIPGRCLLGSSVNIDRLVDTTTSDFHIIGVGANAGFYVTTGITMFDSSLTYVASPVSERIIFDNLQLESSSSALSALVVSQKFLRLTFNNCRFYKIKCCTSSNYLQSFHFNSCYVKGHTGYFLSAVTFQYDLYADCEFEGVGTEQGFSAGLFYGPEIRGIYEGILGPIFNGAAVGLKYAVRYSEGNTNADLQMSLGGPVSRGITIDVGIILTSSTNTANVNFYPLYLGDAKSIVILGATCYSASGGNVNLIDDSSTPLGELTGFGCYTDGGNLTKSGRPLNAPLQALTHTTGLTAAAGSTCGTATQLSIGYNAISTAAGVGYSVGLPTIGADPNPQTTYTRPCLVYNGGANAIQVFVSNFDGPNFGAAATIDGVDAFGTGIRLAPGETRIFYSTAQSPPTWRSYRPIPPSLNTSTSYANDAAASAGGVPVGGFYRNGSVVQIRIA